LMIDEDLYRDIKVEELEEVLRKYEWGGRRDDWLLRWKVDWLNGWKG
jgi:hypothetical protein